VDGGSCKEWEGKKYDSDRTIILQIKWGKNEKKNTEYIVADVCAPLKVHSR
jgi:hypothetical protein